MAYGFEFRDAAGNVVLDSAATGLRLVDTLALDAGETGVFSVPGFDDTKGLFTVIPDAPAFKSNGDMLPYSHDFGVTSTDDRVYLRYWAIPPMSWDNTAKELTVSSPGGPNPLQNHLPSTVFFLHHK